MPATCNNNGRAYEYAFSKAFESALGNINILDNTSLSANEKAWNSLNKNTQDILLTSANAAVSYLISVEPNIKNKETIFYYQPDSKGKTGDVRDLIIENQNWNIGLSIKHNHSAVKHSRLSSTLDFGAKWYNQDCSLDYWDEVNPIFTTLKEYKKNDTKWSELENKMDDVYVPLLKAFLNEIDKIKDNSDLVYNLFTYLIGTDDYYKIISIDNKKETSVSSFNMNNTLNEGDINPPTKIIKTNFKKRSKTTVEVYMDNGWALSFRIHNASSKVEPSLKFDIQFISTPIEAQTVVCPWD